MNTLGYILVFSILGGVVSLIGGVFLLRSKKSAERLAKYATPFAAGALLSAVFLDLLKEGIETSEPYIVLMMTLVGILVFFFLERFLHWFHHHHSHDDKKDPKIGLIIIGDTLHNALDGVAIAAAFLVSVPTGIVTTIAVATHEIPQEVGDFGVLLSKGMRRRNVLLVNFVSALATVAAALAAYLLGTARPESIGILFGLSAGFLLYIALSDLIPEIHESVPKRRLLSWQPILLLLGVITVAVSVNIAHRYIDTGHPHTDEHQTQEIENVDHEHATEEAYDHSPEHEGQSEHGY